MCVTHIYLWDIIDGYSFPEMSDKMGKWVTKKGSLIKGITIKIQMKEITN